MRVLREIKNLIADIVVGRRIGDLQLQAVRFDAAELSAIDLGELPGDGGIVVDDALDETFRNRDAAQRDGARIVQADLQMEGGKNAAQMTADLITANPYAARTLAVAIED